MFRQFHFYSIYLHLSQNLVFMYNAASMITSDHVVLVKMVFNPQITASVTFLPLLNDPCKLPLLPPLKYSLTEILPSI